MSPIDGMPIGVKDIMETASMPTAEGSPLFRGRRTHRDGAAVAALRTAGAIILGKTVTTEFAAVDPGPTHNPWDLNRTPAGRAAEVPQRVGCGMIPVGLGDTSHRIDNTAGKFLWLLWLQTECERDQPWRKFRLQKSQV